MSEYINWDDDDTDEDAQNVPADLRKAHRALKKQNKELMEKLESMNASMRDRSVKDVLSSKGLNPKIAAFIPKDITSAEDVEAWVTEYSEVFGGTVSEGGEDRQPIQDDPALQALSRISAAQSSGQTLSGDAGQMASLIANATSPEELSKLLFGNAAGPQAI